MFRLRFLTLIGVLALTLPTTLTADPVSLPGFSFDDQDGFDATLPKSTGGLTRDTILGVHGSASPNSGIRLDDLIAQIHGSAAPNSGITAKDLGTYGADNDVTVYVGLAPVPVAIPNPPKGVPAPTQDWLFGMLYTKDGPTFAIAKSNVDGLSEVTGYGMDENDADLLAALAELGFGANDVRNVLFAQDARIATPVPVPLPAAMLLTGIVGLGALRRRSKT